MLLDSALVQCVMLDFLYLTCMVVGVFHWCSVLLWLSVLSLQVFFLYGWFCVRWQLAFVYLSFTLFFMCNMFDSLWYFELLLKCTDEKAQKGSALFFILTNKYNISPTNIGFRQNKQLYIAGLWNLLNEMRPLHYKACRRVLFALVCSGH